MKSISSKRSLFAALACVPSVVAAQYGNATASANASTISFHDPTSVSTTFVTKSFNYSLASTYSVQTDFSNERLAALWQQVGPIAAGPVTTTVSPTSSADAVAVQRNYDFVLGWFNDPVWKDGDYPESLRQTLGDTLPTFTDEEKALVKGSCDFFALDGYTSFYASGIDDLEACTSNSSYPGYPECAGSHSTAPDGFPIGPSADGGANWLYSAPVGLRRFLKKITTELFPSVPDIMVTEFGFAEPGEAALSSLNTILWDLRRADYYQSYLDNILASIHYDGVNVTGAFGWAIFDNFEWGSGLNTRFGLQYVNYTSLERTPKASMFTFLNWFSQHI